MKSIQSYSVSSGIWKILAIKTAFHLFGVSNTPFSEMTQERTCYVTVIDVKLPAMCHDEKLAIRYNQPIGNEAKNTYSNPCNIRIFHLATQLNTNHKSDHCLHFTMKYEGFRRKLRPVEVLPHESMSFI
jgi:hypothetical protein